MSRSLVGLRVCYFGHYDPRYSRNRIIMKALRRAGATVVEAHDSSNGIARYRSLVKMAMQIRFDLMVVGFMGHTDVPLARAICSWKRRPLIFDAFISLYDSAVWDRKLVSARSLRARKLYCVDRLACQLADIVLLDTETHIDYFTGTFGVSRAKFRRLWVGADDEYMFPRSDVPLAKDFTVFFYGSFIPLHGVEYIIQAASLLESAGEAVNFILAGSGQTFPEARRLAEELRLNTVRFVGRVPYEDLPRLMCASHVCLGIFGTTPKAQRVIPNKVFDGVAVARPVITADTRAIREIFTHGQNIYLCPRGSGEALAEAILTLKRDPVLRERVGTGGYELFKAHFSIDAISRELRTILQELC